MSQLSPKNSPFEVIISFEKYIDVLEHIRYNDRLEYRVSYAESLIDTTRNFQELRKGFTDISLLNKNENLIKVLLADLFPTGLTKNEIKAATDPFGSVVFNYTERFKNILKDAGTDFNIEIRPLNQEDFYIFSCCLIVNNYFKRNIKTSLPFYYDIPTKDGILKHYKITVNADFIDIYPKPETILPSEDTLDFLLQNLDDVLLWKRHFPEKSWIIKGFNIVSLVDLTTEIALSDLKSTLIKIDPENLEADTNIKEIFKSYFDVSELNFGLMTFNEEERKLEKVPLYENVFTNHILDFWINLLDENTKQMAIQNVEYNPKPVVVNDVDLLSNDIKKIESFKILEDNNIKSFMIIPIVKDHRLLAILEFTSPIANALNGLKLKKIETIADIVVYSLNRFQYEKFNQIEAIIQREYTIIHKSVYWKFRTEAEKKYNAFLARKEYVLKEISFRNIYPLFGQADIRSSSEKRRICLVDDMLLQIKILLHIFSLIEIEETSTFIHQLEELQQEIQFDLKADTEYRLQQILDEKIHPFLHSFATKNTDLLREISSYFKNIHPKMSVFYENRGKLDASIAMVNKTLAEILDKEQIVAQKIFPHYFERFKSDGVEHNLYVGKSITQDLNFKHAYLKDLRFWQLSTAVKIEKEFAKIKVSLPLDLEIASLILAYNEKIDIRFRMDEKRFDIDSAYNSYYEIIKKRLDKSFVKNTNIRLTAPGKITIVYFNEEEQVEYVSYIKQLQDEKLVGENIEFLEVDNLQGIVGLLAMRITII